MDNLSMELKEGKLESIKESAFVRKIIEAFEIEKQPKDYDLKKAKEEWEKAQIFFNNVTDDDELIDYAIFNMEAARIKYFYLLKRMRKERYA